jgi:hypothetical protein
VIEPPGVNPGETPVDLGAPSLDDEGAIAFSGSVGLLPPGSGAETVSFAADGAGGFALLTREGAQAPGLAPGILLAFAAAPRIDAVGEVAFVASLAVGSGGVTFADNAAVYGPAADGSIALLARKGAQAGDLPPGVLYGSVERVDLGSQGDAAFVAGLTGAVTSADDQALFLAPRGGTPVAVLRKGQAIEVAPGDVRTLAAIEVGGADTDARDLLVNAKRQVAAIGVFTDASRAVLVAGLEPAAEVPGAAAPAALLLATLLLASGAARLARR